MVEQTGVILKGFAKFKVPGGKLVEVKLDYSDTIQNIQILGDFFLYPENALKDIEKALVNLRINESEESMAKTIGIVVKNRSITLIGITPEAIAKVIKMAVSR